MKLVPGWNQIKVNLSDVVKRAYDTNYVEALRVGVFANSRVARVAFADRAYAEDEVPVEFRLVGVASA